LDLVQAAANQVSVAVNNAELYRLIRDQAEDLGNMLRSQQIETSRSMAILEAVADGVLVTDSNSQITLFNASAEKILGLGRSQVLSKSMELFSGLFGRATSSWLDTIKSWSEDPSTYQSGDTYAEKFTLEDGRVISVHLAPVISGNDFLGTVSIFQDITHQVEVDRLKSEFVATVSHELRTPMTSIKGYVEILLMGAAGQLSSRQNNFLKVVKANTERLSILVNDLLDVSQIESGQVVLSIQPLNLEDIADQAIQDLNHRVQDYDKKVSIEKEIQINLPPVIGDSERIRRIFDNLLDNAYQYNTEEGKIIIRMHQSEERVQVDIQDTGVGIHPHDQESVFERFFRGENSLSLGISGTGLGLSIVKNMVEMHNGKIWMESKGIPGEGSTFSFTLPMYKPEEDINPQAIHDG
jgi:PAS domain S-box-containing protein